MAEESFRITRLRQVRNLERENQGEQIDGHLDSSTMTEGENGKRKIRNNGANYVMLYSTYCLKALKSDAITGFIEVSDDAFQAFLFELPRLNCRLAYCINCTEYLSMDSMYHDDAGQSTFDAVLRYSPTVSTRQRVYARLPADYERLLLPMHRTALLKTWNFLATSRDGNRIDRVSHGSP